MKKKTEKRYGIFLQPGDITVLASNDKETVPLISIYHIDDMCVSYGKDIIKPNVVCDLKTSIRDVPISKMGQCSCMSWNCGNVWSGMCNCLGDYSVVAIHNSMIIYKCMASNKVTDYWYWLVEKMDQMYIVLCITVCPFNHLQHKSLNVIFWRGLPLLGTRQNLREDVLCSP